jgi:hypothetical protein
MGPDFANNATFEEFHLNAAPRSMSGDRAVSRHRRVWTEWTDARNT